MIDRMLVKVSRPSYDSLGTAATFSTPLPPEKRTVRSTARPIAPTQAFRRLPIIRRPRDPSPPVAMLRGQRPREKRITCSRPPRAGQGRRAEIGAYQHRICTAPAPHLAMRRLDRYGNYGWRCGDAVGDAALRLPREPRRRARGAGG